jgi:hypothetical protein
MITCDTMSRLLRTYDAVLDAHFHQVTLYSLVLEFNDDGDVTTVAQTRWAVENSRRMMISARSRLDTHTMEHGCAAYMEPPAETFRRDLSF